MDASLVLTEINGFLEKWLVTMQSLLWTHPSIFCQGPDHWGSRSTKNTDVPLTNVFQSLYEDLWLFSYERVSCSGSALGSLSYKNLQPPPKDHDCSWWLEHTVDRLVNWDLYSFTVTDCFSQDVLSHHFPAQNLNDLELSWPWINFAFQFDKHQLGLQQIFLSVLFSFVKKNHIILSYHKTTWSTG